MRSVSFYDWIQLLPVKVEEGDTKRERVISELQENDRGDFATDWQDPDGVAYAVASHFCNPDWGKAYPENVPRDVREAVTRLWAEFYPNYCTFRQWASVQDIRREDEWEERGELTPEVIWPALYVVWDMPVVSDNWAMLERQLRLAGNDEHVSAIRYLWERWQCDRPLYEEMGSDTSVVATPDATASPTTNLSPAELMAALRKVMEHKDAHGIRRQEYIAWLLDAERRGHDWAYYALEEIAIGELHDLHEVEGDWEGGRDSLKIDYSWKPDKGE